MRPQHKIDRIAGLVHCAIQGLPLATHLDVGEEIRAWQLHLVEVRQLARSRLVTATAALRFLYTVTLKRDWSVDDIVMSKQPRTLPVILSREEVTAFFESIRSLKHRAILMTAYAGGLRISEVTRLKVGDIDSQRMVLRIEQGKGQVDRYVMLSPRLLEILRTYWQTGRPQHWLFPGRFADQPIVPATIRLANLHAVRASPITREALERIGALYRIEDAHSWQAA
jgi:integrase